MVVGAAALGRFYEMRWRETGDVDFAIALATTEVESTLTELGFRRDARNSLRWHPPIGVPLDVLPITPGALAARKLVLDGGDREMNVTGFELAFAHGVDVAVSESTVKVAIPPVVTLLKMIAWLDRPYEPGATHEPHSTKTQSSRPSSHQARTELTEADPPRETV